MTTIVGLSGSLRRNSFNASLLRAAAELVPDGVELEIGSIIDVPLYNFDVESEHGIPFAVASLKDAIAASDGLLLCTPEYNNSVPGVLKNVIDWLSRPPEDIPRVFGGLPVAVIGASPGRFGTILSQNAWLPVLRTLGASAWSGGRLMVSGANKVFDENGRLADDDIRRRLTKFLADFASFAAKRRAISTQ